jgi:hypothetical protein
MLKIWHFTWTWSSATLPLDSGLRSLQMRLRSGTVEHLSLAVASPALHRGSGSAVAPSTPSTTLGSGFSHLGIGFAVAPLTQALHRGSGLQWHFTLAVASQQYFGTMAFALAVASVAHHLGIGMAWTPSSQRSIGYMLKIWSTFVYERRSCRTAWALAVQHPGVVFVCKRTLRTLPMSAPGLTRWVTSAA